MSSRKFPPIKSKIRPFDISCVMSEFIGSLGASYSIKATASHSTFYTVPNSPNEILVTIKVMRVGLSFPLDPFVVTYLKASGLTSNS